MSIVIAGRFATLGQAEAAMRLLHAQHIVPDEGLSTFYVGPPGQHDRHFLGGDQDADPKAEAAHGSGATGAAVGGAVGLGLAALATGPVAAVAAIGVGAYTGALIGALKSMKPEADPPHADYAMRLPGVMLAVKIDTPEKEAPVVQSLSQQGAQDIEKAEGEWRDGEWVDFDPVAAPHLIGDKD